MVCTVGVGTSADYYLSEQSEYYTGGKEPTGKWFITSDQFSLNNGAEIDAKTFHHLHNGKSPDGKVLEQGNRAINANRVGGYDLTFSAPKSVSVIWALSDEKQRGLIEQAQEKAVRSALQVVSENGAFCRRGKGGAQLEKVNLTGATFQHSEARPTRREDGILKADPQLHTHSVIFNLAQRQDGTWGALDGRHFFKWKMAAGAIYRAELASELQEQLGCKIKVDDKGLFEVKGVPDQVLENFSSRRAEISEKLAAHNLESRDAQELASMITKETRTAKNGYTESAEEQFSRWKEEAHRQGFQLESANVFNSMEAFENKADTWLGDVPNKLTENEAVFKLETMYREVSKAALSNGYSGQDIDLGVKALLSDSSIKPVGKDELGLSVYSSKEMQEVERELISLSSQAGTSDRHSLETILVETELQKSTLSDEQKDGVRNVATGSDLAILEGNAGAGKTHTLRTVCDLYKQEGYRVIGTSTAWRMANQLGEELSIHSQATDAWVSQAQHGHEFLNSKTVLIVDEAGQLSSRQMHQVLKENEQVGAKIILTGDQKQLQAIGAGPGLRLVAEQVGTTRIDKIVRQKEEWMRDAVQNFSIGNAKSAIDAFERHKSISWCNGQDNALNKVVSDWLENRKTDPFRSAIIMARTNKQIDALNNTIREELKKIGALGRNDFALMRKGKSGRPREIKVARGDLIIFTKRLDELGVVNGSLAKIQSIRGNRNGLEINVDVGGRKISFNPADIANEKGQIPISHGYASTIYSSQGITTNTAYVFADSSFNRHDIYVAASRASDGCNIYIDTKALDTSFKAELKLGARSLVTIDKESRLDFLQCKWSRAQEKNAVADFSSSFENEKNNEQKASSSSSNSSFLPSSERSI